MRFENFTKEQLRGIVSNVLSGDSKAQVARDYGTSPRTVGRIYDAYEGGDDFLDESETIWDGFKWPVDTSEASVEFDEDLYAPPDVDGIDLGDEEDEWQDEDEEVEVLYEVVATAKSITIISSDGETVSVNEHSENFSEVSDIVWQGKGSQESLRQAFIAGSIKKKLEETYKDDGIIVDAVRESVIVTDDDGFTHHITGRLLDRLLDALEAGNKEILVNLANFSKKLVMNPSKNSKDELYDFLVANDVKIDEFGDVICWKRVRGDYKDCYSGTIDNSPGSVVKMSRNMVNEDRNQTCSAGLHVCSARYLGSYSGERVVRVAVHPKDFVSVPTDYHNAKARVCEYCVLDDVTDAYNSGKLV